MALPCWIPVPFVIGAGFAFRLRRFLEFLRSTRPVFRQLAGHRHGARPYAAGRNPGWIFAAEQRDHRRPICVLVWIDLATWNILQQWHSLDYRNCERTERESDARCWC